MKDSFLKDSFIFHPRMKDCFIFQSIFLRVLPGIASCTHAAPWCQQAPNPVGLFQIESCMTRWGMSLSRDQKQVACHQQNMDPVGLFQIESCQGFVAQNNSKLTVVTDNMKQLHLQTKDRSCV
jgi:hypothetical protein